LLSLNTATDPDYQGKGLFTRLASMTYDLGAAEGFSCVFGVANANSTPGFIRKLGFLLVAPLEARLGFGSLSPDWQRVAGAAAFRRMWDSKLLDWRLGNPANPLSHWVDRRGTHRLSAATTYPLIRAYAEIRSDMDSVATLPHGSGQLRLFLGMFPDGACTYRTYVPIPRRLRASPLNFIFRNLAQSGDAPAPEDVLFSFLDFDAY